MDSSTSLLEICSYLYHHNLHNVYYFITTKHIKNWVKPHYTCDDLAKPLTNFVYFMHTLQYC